MSPRTEGIDEDAISSIFSDSGSDTDIKMFLKSNGQKKTLGQPSSSKELKLKARKKGLGQSSSNNDTENFSWLLSQESQA